MSDRLAQIIGTPASRVAALAGIALTDADRIAIVLQAGSLEAAAILPWREMPEALRMALVKEAGALPEGIGHEIPEAPARGPIRVYRGREAVVAFDPKGEGKITYRDTGHAGRLTVARADVFDVMRAQAKRRGAVLALTDEQIGMARHYRALVERHEAGAVRCSSVEAMGGGGGGGGDRFTDARLASSRLIDTLRARIGDGVSLQIRRIRPSVRGSRSAISDRALVDRVCLLDQNADAVLAAHGWSVKGDTRQAAITALSAALERMVGLQSHSAIIATRCGMPSPWVKNTV